jgi:hypothetical protein
MAPTKIVTRVTDGFTLQEAFTKNVQMTKTL